MILSRVGNIIPSAFKNVKICHLRHHLQNSMTSFAFQPPPTPTAAILDSNEVFPIHRIYCVGRNYADHVREMGGDPSKGSPTFFTKPADAMVPSESQIPYPMATSNLHYEVELVVCIGKGGVKIPLENAHDHIFGYAVGIDLTRRDLQAAAKSKGMPWDSAKAFDKSAPMGSIRRGSDIDETSRIQLTVNGDLKQSATLNQMIWSIPEILHQLSSKFHLQPGDLIFTGTPSGVGSIAAGDKVVGTVDGMPNVKFELIES